MNILKVIQAYMNKILSLKRGVHPFRNSPIQHGRDSSDRTLLCKPPQITESESKSTAVKSFDESGNGAVREGLVLGEGIDTPNGNLLPGEVGGVRGGVSPALIADIQESEAYPYTAEQLAGDDDLMSREELRMERLFRYGAEGSQMIAEALSLIIAKGA